MEEAFQLGSWLINSSEGIISSEAETKRIEPKALSVLLCLAKAQGQVVSRESLLDCVWPNQYVGDDVINSSISTLRKALGDDRKENKYILTIPKKGYKLVQMAHWHAQNGSLEEIVSQPSYTPKTVSFSRHIYKKPLIITFILVVAFLALYLIQPPLQKEAAAIDNSIAILPFDVYSNNSNTIFFADGLAEEMLHQLSSNPALKVVARSASFQYRDSNKTLSAIASELNVKYLVEGSVREYKNELKITVQLIDAKNNFHLWSRVFDEKSGDLFKIQEQVGVAVNDMLSIKESKNNWTSSRRHPQSVQAYKYFVMAQAHFKAAGANSYKEAMVLLDKAITIAPNYALAYTSKATALLLQFQYNQMSLEEAQKLASSALKQALRLEPDQPEAHAALGLMYTYTQEFDKAETEYLKAIQLNPKLRIAHHNFAFMLWKKARYPQAIKHLEFALETDPLAKPTNFLLGDSLARMGYFDKAIELFKHCQKVLPEYVWCYSGLGEIYRITGDLKQAEIFMERSATLADTGDYWRDNSHASLLIYLNKHQQATKMLDRVTIKTAITNTLLRNRLLIALSTNKMPQFIKRVDVLFKKYPENIEAQKFKALTAFWLNDFSTVVNLYEKVLKKNPATMFELWDYADGISHPLNLALAYEKMGMVKKKQQLLMRIEQHLSSFSGRLENVYGYLYVKAKYNYLLGNVLASQKTLAHLKDKWALSWLATKDYFWKISGALPVSTELGMNKTPQQDNVISSFCSHSSPNFYFDPSIFSINSKFLQCAVQSTYVV